MLTGTIFNIQRYSTQDGPGIRTTVFFKGCPLCCAWCHNPESISPRKELVVVESRCTLCGECREACPLGAEALATQPLLTRNPQCLLCAACVNACPTGARQMIGATRRVDEVVAEVLKDRIFYEDSGGGVTFSGGEPLAQPEFLLAMIESCRRHDLHTVLDTTGFGRPAHLLNAARLSDLVLYDLKAFDDSAHRRLTGVSNRIVLENLQALSAAHRNIWIRIPVVPGFNDDLADLADMARFIGELPGVVLVNLLPFHRTGLHKFARLGLTHGLDGVETPSVEIVASVARVFRNVGLTTKVGG